MLHCLERGADVVGVVRDSGIGRAFAFRTAGACPLTLVVADLATPGALSEALEAAKLERDTLSIVICVGRREARWADRASLASAATASGQTFAPVELSNGSSHRHEANDGARRPARESTAIVLVSSMGRWHGMHHSGATNASKAALSIWGESFRHGGARCFPDGGSTVTIVEPGIVSPRDDEGRPASGVLCGARPPGGGDHRLRRARGAERDPANLSGSRC